MSKTFVDSFNDATCHVLKTMAAVDATPGKATSKSSNKTWGAVTGIISMAGEEYSGSLAISFEADTILKIVSTMLMEEFTEINQDIVDAVGEITNMICGSAKRELDEKGYKFNMASPMIVSGKGVDIRQITTNEAILVPFESDKGSFVVESNFYKKRA